MPLPLGLTAYGDFLKQCGVPETQKDRDPILWVPGLVEGEDGFSRRSLAGRSLFGIQAGKMIGRLGCNADGPWAHNGKARQRHI